MWNLLWFAFPLRDFSSSTKLKTLKSCSEQVSTGFHSSFFDSIRVYSLHIWKKGTQWRLLSMLHWRRAKPVTWRCLTYSWVVSRIIRSVLSSCETREQKFSHLKIQRRFSSFSSSNLLLRPVAKTERNLQINVLKNRLTHSSCSFNYHKKCFIQIKSLFFLDEMKVFRLDYNNKKNFRKKLEKKAKTCFKNSFFGFSFSVFQFSYKNK